jgi:hypothetical protein
LFYELGEELKNVVISEGLSENYYGIYKIMYIFKRSQEKVNGKDKITYRIDYTRLDEWKRIGSIAMYEKYFK